MTDEQRPQTSAELRDEMLAELRALRALRDEVEPVLRREYWLHNPAYAEEACDCGFCVVTRRHIFGTENAADHYDKKEPK